MIVKDIDAICRKNNIEYYLIGGSCIGAIRHKGFIPWDDDLDIALSDYNYKRLLTALRNELDSQKYYIQEGRKDWPLNYTKVKLIGTHILESEGQINNPKHDGIFVDIFKMDNIIDNKLLGRWQYLCGKYYLSYQLSVRKYHSAGIKKKMLMALSVPLRIKFIRNYIIRQVEKYNNQPTDYWGFLYGRTRWKSGVVLSALFGTPLYLPFEDTTLPVPEKYHEYLTQVFGDYMKLPPENQQIGSHIIKVDFGDY